MFCTKCGTKTIEGQKFCMNCGALMPHTKIVKPPAPEPEDGKGKKAAKATKPSPAAKAPTPAQKAATPAPNATPAIQPTPAPVQPVQVPKAAAPAGPAIDVKNIVINPPKVMALEETIDFSGAEHALETENLKVRAHSGIFSSPMPGDVRVESITKVYEPINTVRAVYEGTFEVAKEFNLQLDPYTVKLNLEGRVYDIPAQAAPNRGIFGGGASPQLKLVGTETIKKRVEKAVCYDKNGVQKNNLDALIRGKNTVPFSPRSALARTTVVENKFSASGLVNQVLTPDIVQRQQNAKSTISEKITVDVLTIYYPKYKALVKNLKNNQERYLIISAVDKQILPNETF